ncbi:MAG TPA: GNAT family N-acetyltransferase, partial [Candidatus Competibacteraceae bacterium]|nr:GNAT family N-acetyltransferase [Candidatus Competibacteraceae bacterium]
MTVKALRIENPLDPVRMATLKHWGDLPAHTALEDMRSEATVDCGWGRLIFGQTFRSPERLAREICREAPGRRDVALYIRDPHVVVSLDPQKLFLDPSHTFRLPLRDVNLDISADRGWRIRQIAKGADLDHDEAVINRLYQMRGMVPVHEGFLAHNRGNSMIAILVAEADDSGEILGVVTGVDHVLAFNDPDQGASLWSLAVDPQCLYPGIGAGLVKALAAFFQARQRTYLDLSVMHDNVEAIALYRKLGFQRVPVYCVKHKNPINEKLFVGPDRYSDLNIYARIIVDEARRRGIAVDILDAQHGYFRLSRGGRSITCRESLCELTSAIAMSRCDDKRVTRNVLTAPGIRMPAQILADDAEAVRDFLARYQR